MLQITSSLLSKAAASKLQRAKFSYQQKEKVKQWIADHHMELLPSVINFNAGRWSFTISSHSVYIVPQVSKLVPVSWWKSLKRFSKTSRIQNLADVMIHLLSCPTSSASVKCLFLASDWFTRSWEIGLAWTVQQNLWFATATGCSVCCVSAQQKTTADDYWLNEY